MQKKQRLGTSDKKQNFQAQKRREDVSLFLSLFFPENTSTSSSMGHESVGVGGAVHT